MSVAANFQVRFGLFEFDPASGELRKRGLSVHLTPQARTFLSILLEQPIRTHSREEIQQLLWPQNIHVDFESGVNKVVHSLRETLGESARNPRFIETVAAGGYRFLSESLAIEAPTIPSPLPSTIVRRVAVLPPRCDGNHELQSVSRIISWHLTEWLSLTPGLRVLAESTLYFHPLEKIHPSKIGETLGVQTIITGALTRQGDQLLAQFELVDAHDGALTGSAVLESNWPPTVRSERELALEAYRRIYPFLDIEATHAIQPQSILLATRTAKVS
ncbi:MAG: winged helix-turn-helix domain-containing protein [Acidobacteriota bacterium]|nr:winged helix-turn-helix domain-containing protein [Acidobacteriota bacterium]